ncbi:MAG: site-specific DNA-methyltransferase [Bacilli bacterium]|nr:site-specific DNA-methyltransferase [Bacilli bacterium]
MTKISKGYYFRTQYEKMKTIDTTQPRGSLGNDTLNGGRRSTLTHETFRVSSSQLNARSETEINVDKRLQDNKQDALVKNTYTGFNLRYEPPKKLLRQVRSSWEINTQGISEAHFATFPTTLVERMLLSGCPLEDGRIVLDPFCGSGTTGMVAKEYGLDFIGIELYTKNVKLSKKRIDSIVSYFRLFEGL